MALAATTLVACSSGGSGTASGGPAGRGTGTSGNPNDQSPPEVSADTTWGDGHELPTPVVIDVGTTVTIAPGATIHAVQGITITVKGTLKSAPGAGSTITSDTKWTGILVAPGGTLQLDGVALDNAVAPLDVQGGAASASFTNGTIDSANSPFVVESGGKLSVAHVKVTGTKAISHIQGEIDASYLDYDSNGNDGLTAESDQAVISVEDSTMHGAAGTTDMFVSYQGAGRIHVAYTEITNVHCAFHIERIIDLDVSHVTATSDYTGFMLYGTLPNGTRTITQSNLMGNSHTGVEEAADSVNGTITFSDDYIANNALQDVLTHAESGIQVTSPASAAFPDAHPR
jgi:hypothetical protein